MEHGTLSYADSKKMPDIASEATGYFPFRKYENGYEAHIIDKHPHGKTYRDPRNPSGIVALPQESIMLLTNTWAVVMFLNNIEDLNRIEYEMNLKRII